MDADLDTLATALYVTCDDVLKAHPERVAPRRAGTFTARISDAEIITLSVLQALLGVTSERRWIRHARTHLLELFPDLPTQSGYNKRLRALAPTLSWLISTPAAMTSVGDDDLWVADCTPIECGRSRETALRSDLAGWAQYGYCASHSRYFWGLRLHLVCTVHGLPVGWALTGAKADERHALHDILTTTTHVSGILATGPRTIIADKNYYGREFERDLAAADITVLRPARKGEKRCVAERFFKPLRQIIESVNDTLKGQLDLEAHGGRTVAGVCARITQRILALTAAIWHNDRIGATIRRSLTAYDH